MMWLCVVLVIAAYGCGLAINANAISRERQRAMRLWDILDDIDTLDDACREHDAAFRKRVREHVHRRFEHFKSDGHTLYPREDT